MINVSISELKKNPSSILSAAVDYPIAVKNRDKTKGYFIGKNLFEKIIDYIEDVEDAKAVEKADLSKATSFEEFAKELGI